MRTPDREARLARLFARTHAGIKPGLDLMRELLEALGNPQERFLSVHVAGTNGKGSTCAILESLLRHTGLRAGLYTSPHLARVEERIRIQGRMISADRFDAALDAIEAVEDSLSRPPTFFEILTAAAFHAFAEEEIQIAVLETGMGGRLDATNVVTPLVSVITRIDMDHMEYLGATLTAIAGEKAGILKPGRPAVTAPQMEEAEAVLRERAEALGVPRLQSGEHVRISQRTCSLSGQRLHLETPEGDYGKIHLPLLGRFQLDALATALTAYEQVCDVLGIPVDPDTVKLAVAAVEWPARVQVLREEPPVILDVSHNPGGAAALAETLREVFGKKARGRFVAGMMRDKDATGFLRALRPLIAELWCTSIDQPRALSPEEFCGIAACMGIPARVVALAEAKARIAEKAPGEFTCIAGSVYLAGAWLEDAAVDPGEQSSIIGG